MHHAAGRRRARFAAKSTAPLGDAPEKGGRRRAVAREGRPGEGRPREPGAASLGASQRESLRRRSGTRRERFAENAKKRIVSGIKNVVVTPLSHEECTQLKAADALNNRRGYVAKKSDDQLAYIYLEDMEQMGEGASNSFDDFAAQFYPAIRKAGLIIDVRRNAGGNIDTWILERLRRVAWMFNTQLRQETPPCNTRSAAKSPCWWMR